MLKLTFDILVSTSWTLPAKRFSNSSDWDSSTTVSSSDLTRPPWTWSEELSPTSLMDTLHRVSSESSSTREATERSKDPESLSPITASLRRYSASMVSPALKISFTKSQLLDPTSRRPTTSSGPSSSTHPRRDSLPRDTPTKMAVLGATEKTSSTSSSRECSEQIVVSTAARHSECCLDTWVMRQLLLFFLLNMLIRGQN